MIRRLLLHFLAAIFVLIPTALAQVDKATFEGVALDQSGSLPGVTVTLTRPETGCRSHATLPPREIQLGLRWVF